MFNSHAMIYQNLAKCPDIALRPETNKSTSMSPSERRAAEITNLREAEVKQKIVQWETENQSDSKFLAFLTKQLYN